VADFKTALYKSTTYVIWCRTRVNWAYANGGKVAADLDYVPMPASVVAAIQKSWSDIKDNAGKPVAYK